MVGAAVEVLAHPAGDVLLVSPGDDGVSLVGDSFWSTPCYSTRSQTQPTSPSDCLVPAARHGNGQGQVTRPPRPPRPHPSSAAPPPAAPPPSRTVFALRPGGVINSTLGNHLAVLPRTGERDSGHRKSWRRGLRPHGLGHRRSGGTGRPRRAGGRPRPGHPREGAGPCERLHLPGGERRQADRGRGRRGSRAHRVLHRHRVAGRPSAGHRGGCRVRAREALGLPVPRQGRRGPRGGPGLEHLLHPDHEAGHGHQPAQPGHRHPLLQSGAGAAAGRTGHLPA